MPQMLRDQAFRRMVPVVGLEPTRSRPRRILNLIMKSVSRGLCLVVRTPMNDCWRRGICNLEVRT